MKDTTVIFVTIGHPFSKIPIMQKVSCFVDLEIETPVKTAKKLRNMVADNITMYGYVKDTRFNPSDLYYELYYNVDDKIPSCCSANSPTLRVIC